MIYLLFKLWSIFESVCLWGSFGCMLAMTGKMMYAQKNGPPLRYTQWARLVLGMGYIVGFLWLRLSQPDFFSGVGSIVCIIATLIASQLVKYGDHMAGKRWWTE